MLQICICDDGMGFDVNRLTHVGGIENMRARIEQSLGGIFTLATQPSQGTRITYLIPLRETKETNHDPIQQAATSIAR